MAAVSGSC